MQVHHPTALPLQILICPVSNWVPHRSNKRFAILEGRYVLQTPMSATVPPWPRPLLQAISRAQPKKRRAGRNGPIRWAITPPFFVQNSPNLREMSAMQLSSGMPVVTFFTQIFLIQKHQRSRRHKDPAVFKRHTSRGRES